MRPPTGLAEGPFGLFGDSTTYLGTAPPPEGEEWVCNFIPGRGDAAWYAPLEGAGRNLWRAIRAAKNAAP